MSVYECPAVSPALTWVQALVTHPFGTKVDDTPVVLSTTWSGDDGPIAVAIGTTTRW